MHEQNSNRSNPVLDYLEKHSFEDKLQYTKAQLLEAFQIGHNAKSPEEALNVFRCRFGIQIAFKPMSRR